MTLLDPLQYAAAIASGGLVGFALGLVGGGGSILAVPLLTYFVGVPTPHMAIGTSAVAVAVNATANLVPHARRGSVRWRCASIFALAGLLGALAGSTLGKAFDGQKLLFLFALLMVAVGGIMLRQRDGGDTADQDCNRRNAPKVAAFGLGAGTFSGFFGIGGGFLIVPALMASTGMSMRRAVGSSLVAVAAFGMTAAANYAFSGLIDWLLAGALIAGGVVGGVVGTIASHRLAKRKGLLNSVFAGLVFLVAAYMLWRSGTVIMRR